MNKKTYQLNIQQKKFNYLPKKPKGFKLKEKLLLLFVALVVL
jgi:hypothetical protein